MAEKMEMIFSDDSKWLAFGERIGDAAMVRVYRYADWKSDGLAPPITHFETASRGLKANMRREMKRLGAGA